MVQFIPNNARLYIGPALLYIDLNNGVHIPSGIQHGAISYDLACEGSPGTTRDEGLSRFYNSDNLLSRFWKNHSFWFFLIDGSILRICTLE